MMKKNSTPTLIEYGWNLFLFARTFRAEVDAPPDVVAAALRQMQHDKKRWPQPSQDATVEQAEEHLYAFDMRAYEKLGPWKITSVKATGRVLYSKGYDATVIQGDQRLGWLNYIVGLVLILGLTLQILTDGIRNGLGMEWLVVVPVLVFFYLLSFGQLVTHYRSLNRDLQQTLDDLGAAVEAERIQSVDELAIEDVQPSDDKKSSIYAHR